MYNVVIISRWVDVVRGLCFMGSIAGLRYPLGEQVLLRHFASVFSDVFGRDRNVSLSRPERVLVTAVSRTLAPIPLNAGTPDSPRGLRMSLQTLSDSKWKSDRRLLSPLAKLD